MPIMLIEEKRGIQKVQSKISSNKLSLHDRSTVAAYPELDAAWGMVGFGPVALPSPSFH